MDEQRFVISDDVWARLGPLLPGKQGDSGATGKDNRLFLEAVLWRVRTGVPWRDLPREFGNWNSVFRRFRRWAHYTTQGCLRAAGWGQLGDSDQGNVRWRTEPVPPSLKSCAPSLT